jgi:transcriptional regulator with XRE-family HTH domain
MATETSPLRAWRRRQAKREGGVFTQRQAADLLGTTQGTYSDWETLQKSPRPNNMLRISQVTGIPLEKLIIAFAGAEKAA